MNLFYIIIELSKTTKKKSFHKQNNFKYQNSYPWTWKWRRLETYSTSVFSKLNMHAYAIVQTAFKVSDRWHYPISALGLTTWPSVSYLSFYYPRYNVGDSGYGCQNSKGTWDSQRAKLVNAAFKSFCLYGFDTQLGVYETNKNRFEENPLIWKNFWSYKVLYSCRVSHFSLEIFAFVWYVNNSTAYVTLQNVLLENQEYH